MYIDFRKNRVCRSVKTVHTNLFAQYRKLHKFSTTNSNFEKKNSFRHTSIMHFRLRELANRSNPPQYPNINIDNDVTTRSLTGFSKHIKSKFLSGYSLHCDIGACYACNNS